MAEVANYYESLQAYFKNGCVLHPGMDPVIGEVGYKEHVLAQFKKLNIVSGDTILVHYVKPGVVATETGILLGNNRDRVFLLTAGKKVWKNQKNEKQILIQNILSVEKIKDKDPSFLLSSADPFGYRAFEVLTPEERRIQMQEKYGAERTASFQKRLARKFPDIDCGKQILLWLSFDFCWNYQNGSVAGVSLSLWNKDRSLCTVPEYTIRKVYPNPHYYSVCGVSATDEESNGLYMVFDSMEELRSVQYIFCDWKVEVDGKFHHFVTAVRPKFVQEYGNVYSVACCSTDMAAYERSLHENTFFSGTLERDFELAYVLFPLSPGYYQYPIYRANNTNANMLSLKDRLPLLKDMGDFEKIEILLCCKEVYSTGYLLHYPGAC